ncbi:hypothetical protein [Clostridium perfringens]|nr:hypothetical protein [Clostridium perfringens]
MLDGRGYNLDNKLAKELSFASYYFKEFYLITIKIIVNSII